MLETATEQKSLAGAISDLTRLEAEMHRLQWRIYKIQESRWRTGIVEGLFGLRRRIDAFLRRRAGALDGDRRQYLLKTLHEIDGTVAAFDRLGRLGRKGLPRMFTKAEDADVRGA